MTLAIGVIGTGAIGRDHAARITRTLAGGRVVAVSDIDPAAARATVETLGLDARVFATGPELIAHPEVEAIVVTSWGATHEALVLAALAAGKPVFCEKPLATTAAGAMNVVRAETALGRRLVQVGFMRRYDTGYRALKAAVDDGAIGAPLVVHCAHRNVSAPDTATNAESITETFIHELDILRWLLADDYVERPGRLPAPHPQRPPAPRRPADRADGDRRRASASTPRSSSTAATATTFSARSSARPAPPASPIPPTSSSAAAPRSRPRS